MVPPWVFKYPHGSPMGSHGTPVGSTRPHGTPMGWGARAAGGDGGGGCGVGIGGGGGGRLPYEVTVNPHGKC